MNNPRTWLPLGLILAALSVVTGAFGAHGLEGRLESIHGTGDRTIAGLTVPASYKYLRDFNTAADYQMTHALGLIALGIVAGRGTARLSHRVAAWCFVLGIVLFSGSLYVLVLTGQKWLGAITPIGGTLMIVAWVSFALSCRSAPHEPTSTASKP